MKHISIYTDGGARGNPGPAGVGVVIFDSDDKIIKEVAKYIGETTNNIAEYQALLLGMQEAKKLKVDKVDFYLDSELVVKQLNHQYKIKNQELGKIFIQIWNLSQSFKSVSYTHILRTKNKLADNLVNKAIDQHKS